MSHEKHYVDDVTIDRTIMNIEGLLAGQVKPFKGDPESVHYLLMIRKFIDKYITLLRAKEQGRAIFYYDDLAPVSQDQVENWRGIGSPCEDFSEYQKIPKKIKKAKKLLEDYWEEKGYYLEFCGLDDDDDFCDEGLEKITENVYEWDDEFLDAAQRLEKNNILVYRSKIEDH